MSPILERLQLQALQQLAPLRARYEALQSREQMVVAVGGVVAVLALIYLLLWEPFELARMHRLRDLDDARDLALRLEVLGAQAQLTHDSNTMVLGADMPLLSAVDKAAKDPSLGGKAPTRMQPDGESQVRVWLEDVPFDALLRWMYGLQGHYGVRIDSVAIERRPTAGQVNARLSLVRAK